MFIKLTGLRKNNREGFWMLLNMDWLTDGKDSVLPRNVLTINCVSREGGVN